MIDVSDVIHSPEFEREITIERTSAGHWEKSEYQSTKTTLTVYGVLVNPKNSKEIQQTEEGDRAAGYIDIYVDGSTPIYVTREAPLTAENNISDIVIDTDGTRYRVTNVFNRARWGFYKAQAQREGGI
jgi:hypothetical protein